MVSSNCTTVGGASDSMPLSSVGKCLMLIFDWDYRDSTRGFLKLWINNPFICFNMLTWFDRLIISLWWCTAWVRKPLQSVPNFLTHLSRRLSVKLQDNGEKLKSLASFLETSTMFFYDIIQCSKLSFFKGWFAFLYNNVVGLWMCFIISRISWLHIKRVNFVNVCGRVFVLLHWR